jgi:hypothetical protein
MRGNSDARSKFKNENKVDLCSQCGKPAVAKVSNIYLCVEHNLQFEQAEQMQHNRLVDLGNISRQLLYESIFGIVTPPHPSPTYSPFPGDSMTLNNINVDRSTIGALNTGNIASLDIVMTRIHDQPELYQAIKNFTEAILNSTEIPMMSRTKSLSSYHFFLLR